MRFFKKASRRYEHQPLAANSSIERMCDSYGSPNAHGFLRVRCPTPSGCDRTAERIPNSVKRVSQLSR